LWSEAETAADTVVEERERGNGAGPTRPERWSGEARAPSCPSTMLLSCWTGATCGSGSAKTLNGEKEDFAKQPDFIGLNIFIKK
jgi:hypothetical protein